MQILTIVGARPQFVKAAVVSRALREAGVQERMIHTGQHYDHEMSRVFFDELGIPEPEVDLGVGSGTHAQQTGQMMIGLEEVVLRGRRPDWVLVYGDTNSTLAGALVAAKLHLPVAHVEAGLRSFNRRMPEEINRVVTDQLSTLCFCPTPTAVENLQKEGLTRGVHLTGDVMLDATRAHADRAAARVPLSSVTTHEPGSYFLATVHRAENTDAPERLFEIFRGFAALDGPVLLPLHPRTRARLASVDVPPNVELLPPVSYLTMLTLTRHARFVLTDSGGLQKEAVWLGVPCITLRDETEWIETQEGGWNQVVGANARCIADAVQNRPAADHHFVDDVGASAQIVYLLHEHGGVRQLQQGA